MRYLIAAIFFLIIGGLPKKETLKPGVLMGFFLWLGYISQTQGLVTTSTINSGVVTGFYVVLTPFFSRAINKTSLSRNNYMYSVLGFIGIVLISITDFSQIFGNIFTFICAIAYAMHIVFVERYVSNLSISQLMAVQSITGAILCLVGAFYLQLYGQKIIKASTSALILSLEAIFALFIGILIAGEILGLVSWIGVLLVLLSIFLVIKE